MIKHGVDGGPGRICHDGIETRIKMESAQPKHMAKWLGKEQGNFAID